MEETLSTNQQNQIQLDEIVGSSKVEMTYEREKGRQSVKDFLKMLLGFLQLSENDQEEAGNFLGDHYDK